MKFIKKAEKSVKEMGQTVGAFLTSPSRSQIQFVLFAAGVTLLTVGLMSNAHAQLLGAGGGIDNVGGGGNDGGQYSDTRIARSVGLILTYLEGSFGALVMVTSGIGAILSAAFGQYKAALGCLVVAVGAFILRSFLQTFFNITAVTQSGGLDGGGIAGIN